MTMTPLPLDELVGDAKAVLEEEEQLWELLQNDGLESAGAALAYHVHPHAKFAHPDLTYWRRLKREFCLLTCSNDPKYEDLRKQIRQTPGGGAVALSTIAAIIGINLGIAAAVLLPFVALLVFGTARLGVEAFCGPELPPDP